MANERHKPLSVASILFGRPTDRIKALVAMIIASGYDLSNELQPVSAERSDRDPDEAPRSQKRQVRGTRCVFGRTGHQRAPREEYERIAHDSRIT